MPEAKKQLHPNSIHLTVANVPRSVKFYKEKLGFTLAETFPDKKKPVWANMLFRGQSLMLGELPSLAEARQWGMSTEEIEVLKQDARAFARGSVGVGVCYYVLVDDVDAYAKRLKRKRVKLLTSPKTQVYGLRDFQVADPDGYRLVFFTPVEAGCSEACDATCGAAAGVAANGEPGSLPDAS